MEIFKMTGKVFDIRRFSTHDGDGIRTTVFLKGCPLKCVWCQNPEGISIRKRPIYFENRCIHCKTCIAKSKEHGVTLEEDQIHLHPDKNDTPAQAGHPYHHRSPVHRKSCFCRHSPRLRAGCNRRSAVSQCTRGDGRTKPRTGTTAAFVRCRGRSQEG